MYPHGYAQNLTLGMLVILLKNNIEKSEGKNLIGSHGQINYATFAQWKYTFHK